MGTSGSRRKAASCGDLFERFDEDLFVRCWPAPRVITGARVNKRIRDILESTALQIVLKVRRGKWEPGPFVLSPEDRVLQTVTKYACPHGVGLEFDFAGSREHVDALMNALQILGSRFSQFQVARLEAGGCRLYDSRQLTNIFGSLRGLTHLALGANRFGPETFRVVESLPDASSLKHLRLRWNGVRHGAEHLLQEIARCKQLEHLDLRRNYIDDIGAAGVGFALEHLTNLKHLDLASNSIGPAGFDHLANGLANHKGKSLAFLNVSDNWLDEGSRTALLNALSQHRGLTHLGLAYTTDSWGADGLRDLSMLHQCPHLSSLDLSASSLASDVDAASFAQVLHGFSALRQLRVADCARTRRGGLELLPLPLDQLPYPPLRTLNLARNSLGGEAWRAVGAGLLQSSSLQELDLSGNPIRVEGAVLLGRVLEGAAGLRKLRVGLCGLRAAGTAEVARGLRRSTLLEELDVSRNDMLWRGAAVLAETLGGLLRLRYVDVRGNHLRLGLRVVVEALKQPGHRPVRVLSSGNNANC